ncbi:MAG: DEAD/DEAH box helicase [Planctomycetota bacterium]|jgi:ATP-dependent RNA helicase DeaD
MGFAHPTQIQAQLIPIVLSGKDMLGQARTGSGKTAAFGLPAINMVERGMPFQTLILCPTRELAIQIDRELDELAAFTTINSVPVFGGQPIPKQLKRLESDPEIIVATPGRLMDLYEHRHIHFRNIKQIILDEVDRMLDIGFRDDIRNILKNIKHDHQTIFVSATISSEIETLARQFMTDPEKIVTTAGSLTVNTVTQHYCPINRWDKKRLLVHLLTHEEPALTVVFCKTKRMVDALAKHLRDNNVEAQAIHGDLPQGKRNRVMEKLRSGKLSVLVASDLAARGLDVDGITHVVNYDIPEDPEVYIHRIGRTARAGKDGEAWTFVTPEEGDLLTQVEVLANIHIPELEYPDFTPSEPPRGVREAQAAKAREREIAQSLNRYETTVPAAKEGKVDETKFPGGLVPTKMPPKRIGGKVNTARSQKAILAEKKAKQDDA